MAGFRPADTAAFARDHYAVLGVYEPADYTPEEALARIQAAACIGLDELKTLYHQAALQRHPDKLASHTGAGSIASTEAFQQLQNAWNCLQNPKTRNEYDKWLLADAVLKCQQAKTQQCLQMHMPAVPPEQMPAVPPEQMPVVPPVPPPMQAEPITANAGSSDNPFVKRLKQAVRVRLPGSTDGVGRTFKHCDYMNPNVCSQVADAYFAQATYWMEQMKALTGTQAIKAWMQERGFAHSGTRATRMNRTPAHAHVHLIGGMHGTCSIWNAFQNAFHTYEHMRLLLLLLLLSPHVFDLSTFQLSALKLFSCCFLLFSCWFQNELVSKFRTPIPHIGVSKNAAFLQLGTYMQKC